MAKYREDEVVATSALGGGARYGDVRWRGNYRWDKDRARELRIGVTGKSKELKQPKLNEMILNYLVDAKETAIANCYNLVHSRLTEIEDKYQCKTEANTKTDIKANLPIIANECHIVVGHFASALFSGSSLIHLDPDIDVDPQYIEDRKDTLHEYFMLSNAYAEVIALLYDFVKFPWCVCKTYMNFNDVLRIQRLIPKIKAKLEQLKADGQEILPELMDAKPHHGIRPAFMRVHPGDFFVLDPNLPDVQDNPLTFERKLLSLGDMRSQREALAFLRGDSVNKPIFGEIKNLDVIERIANTAGMSIEDSKTLEGSFLENYPSDLAPYDVWEIWGEIPFNEWYNQGKAKLSDFEEFAKFWGLEANELGGGKAPERYPDLFQCNNFRVEVVADVAMISFNPPYWHNQKPYGVGSFRKKGQSLTGIPIPDILDANAESTNALWRYIHDNAKLLAMLPLVINQLRSSAAEIQQSIQENGYLEVKGIPKEVVEMLNIPNAINELMGAINLNRGVEKELIATSVFEGLPSGETATAETIAMQRANTKMEPIYKSFLNDVIQPIFNQADALVQQFISEDVRIRQHGESGKYIRRIDPVRLLFPCRIKCVGSLQEGNPQVMLQTLVNWANLRMPMGEVDFSVFDKMYWDAAKIPPDKYKGLTKSEQLNIDPAEENKILMAGFDVPVNRDEDHDKMLSVHQMLPNIDMREIIMRIEAGEAQPDAISRHIEKHLRFKKEKQAQIQKLQQQQGAGAVFGAQNKRLGTDLKDQMRGGKAQ